MADREIRYQTLMIFTIVIVVILIATVFLASGQTDDVRLFIILLNTLLVSTNVIAFFLIWNLGRTLIDEVFVMTPSGLLLKHYTRRLRPDQDENILAGMLTAVQNFIEDSFDEGGGRLNEIRFENYDIMITYSDNVVIAAVIATKNPQKLREKLSDAAREIEQHYGHSLSEWDGDTSKLAHIDHVMKHLLKRV